MHSRYCLSLMICASLLLPALVSSAVFVCSNGDTGCLIASIAKSNANGPDHDLLLLQAGAYVLDRVDNQDPNDSGTGLPVITGILTIVGAGENETLLQRDPTAAPFRLFDVGPPGTLVLAQVTVQGGEVDAQLGRGGCLRVQRGGTLVLARMTVRECSANIGGGIDSFGTLLVLRTTITDNFAEFVGGGLTAIGPLTRILDGSWIGGNAATAAAGIAVDPSGLLRVEDSVITENVATLTGGGGVGGPGQVVMERVLTSENFSGLRGGGFDLQGGEVLVRDSTYVGNEAEVFGGGVYVGAGELVLETTSLLLNAAHPVFGTGGGLVNDQGTVTLRNSTLLFNRAAQHPECFGALLLEGVNVIGDPTRFVDPRQGNPCQ